MYKAIKGLTNNDVIESLKKQFDRRTTYPSMYDSEFLKGIFADFGGGGSDVKIRPKWYAANHTETVTNDTQTGFWDLNQSDVKNAGETEPDDKQVMYFGDIQAWCLAKAEDPVESTFRMVANTSFLGGTASLEVPLSIQAFGGADKSQLDTAYFAPAAADKGIDYGGIAGGFTMMVTGIPFRYVTFYLSQIGVGLSATARMKWVFRGVEVSNASSQF